MGVYNDDSIYNSQDPVDLTPYATKQELEQNGKGVFWVTYNVTTLEELQAAVTDGKQCVLIEPGTANKVTYAYMHLDNGDGAFNFFTSPDDSNAFTIYSLSSAGVWSKQDYTIGGNDDRLLIIDHDTYFDDVAHTLDNLNNILKKKLVVANYTRFSDMGKSWAVLSNIHYYDEWLGFGFPAGTPGDYNNSVLYVCDFWWRRNNNQTKGGKFGDNITNVRQCFLPDGPTGTAAYTRVICQRPSAYEGVKWGYVGNNAYDNNSTATAGHGPFIYCEYSADGINDGSIIAYRIRTGGNNCFLAFDLQDNNNAGKLCIRSFRANYYSGNSTGSAFILPKCVSADSGKVVKAKFNANTNTSVETEFYLESINEVPSTSGHYNQILRSGNDGTFSWEQQEFTAEVSNDGSNWVSSLTYDQINSYLNLDRPVKVRIEDPNETNTFYYANLTKRISDGTHHHIIFEFVKYPDSGQIVQATLWRCDYEEGNTFSLTTRTLLFNS